MKSPAHFGKQKQAGLCQRTFTHVANKMTREARFQQAPGPRCDLGYNRHHPGHAEVVRRKQSPPSCLPTQAYHLPLVASQRPVPADSQGARTQAREHEPGPGSMGPATGAPREGGCTGCALQGAALRLCLLLSLPEVSDPPMSPGCSRWVLLLQEGHTCPGVGLRHPHGARGNPAPTERGSAHSEHVEKPHFI